MFIVALERDMRISEMLGKKIKIKMKRFDLK